MEKKNTENLRNTIISKINASQNADDLTKVSKELIEWIDWLKLNKKISKRFYSELRTLIIDKEESRTVDWVENLENTTKSKGARNYLWLFLFIVLFVLVFIFNSFDLARFVSPPEPGNHVPKTIPFRGTLKNANGIPIDTKTDVVFHLYNRQDSETPLYEGKCIGTEGLVPDYRGEFTVVLGADCNMKPIDGSVLENEVLFLGVTIGTGEEIIPRYRILSSTYSQNSAQVAGRTVGTEKNDIPYINENGSIFIEAYNPSLKATNGELLIEGASLSLKTASGGEGDILLQPDAGGSIIIPSGNLGLGIFEPRSKLEVVGMEPYNAIASIANISTEDNENTSVLSLGLGTVKSAKDAKFISFRTDVTKDDNGQEIGSIRVSNEAVTYETTGADFAEYFDSTFHYPVSTIISLSSRGIDIAHKNETLVGVVSDQAGFVGNSGSESERQLLVGLIGQVYVFTTNENGNIVTGDPIGVGSVPGYGIRAKDTNTVGYSLEDMKGIAINSGNCPEQYRHLLDQTGSPIKCGRIKILLKPK